MVGGAVVTGAGSGIGRALALGLAKRGHDLALCDVDRKGLSETIEQCRAARAGLKAFDAIVDVSNYEQMKTFAEGAIASLKQITLVFNNAGISSMGKFEEDDLEMFRKVMDINFWGTVYGTKLFLPHLIEQDSAVIVDLCSLFGIVGVPYLSAYCSSKFAVKGFYESLRQELAAFHPNVKLLCVQPGGVRTSIAQNSVQHSKGKELTVSHDEARLRKLPPGKNTVTLKSLADDFDNRLAKTSPSSAARQILAVANTSLPQSRRLLVGVDAKVGDVLVRLMPSRYAHIFNYMMSAEGKTPKLVIFFVLSVFILLVAAALALFLW
eukprot:m.64836 g.64836  ORF g.64836 m.64836 type:complete len:323 (+) comp13620_c0_seq1:1282-2250(+)